MKNLFQIITVFLIPLISFSFEVTIHKPLDISNYSYDNIGVLIDDVKEVVRGGL